MRSILIDHVVYSSITSKNWWVIDWIYRKLRPLPDIMSTGEMLIWREEYSSECVSEGELVFDGHLRESIKSTRINLMFNMLNSKYSIKRTSLDREVRHFLEGCCVLVRMDFVRNSKGANTGLKIFMISNEEHLRAICHLLFAKFLKNSLIMPVDFQTFQPHSLRKDFTSFGGALQGARDAQGSEFFRLFIRSQLYQLFAMFFAY